MRVLKTRRFGDDDSDDDNDDEVDDLEVQCLVFHMSNFLRDNEKWRRNK